MRVSLFALVGLACVAAPARAQVSFVPLAGYDIDYEAPMVGLGVELGVTPGFLPATAGIRPSAEYVFYDSDVTLVRLNGDIIARFNAPAVSFSPYGKAGIALEYFSYDDIAIDLSAAGRSAAVTESSTEVGLNLGAGAEFTRFLVEGTLGIGNVSSFRVTAGYRF